MKQEDFQYVSALTGKAIIYRPEFNSFTGGMTASILLQQILYWWMKQDNKSFYKFKEPCDHILYKTGDSWIEELGITRRPFDTALKKIGKKIRLSEGEELVQGKAEDHTDCLVYYWTNRDNMTFYYPNITELTKKHKELTDKIYDNHKKSRETYKCEKSPLPDFPESSETPPQEKHRVLTDNTTTSFTKEVKEVDNSQDELEKNESPAEETNIPSEEDKKQEDIQELEDQTGSEPPGLPGLEAPVPEKPDTPQKESQEKRPPSEAEIEVFEWVKLFSEKYDLQMPRDAGTKRIQRVVESMLSLANGDFWSKPMNREWLEKYKLDLDVESNKFNAQCPDGVDSIKHQLQKAIRKDYQARQDCGVFYPGNRKEKMSVADFILDERPQREGQSLFIYWLMHEVEKRYDVDGQLNWLKENGIDFPEELPEMVYGESVTAEFDNLTDADEDKFYKGVIFIVKWYQKEYETLSQIGEGWYPTIEGVLDIFTMLGKWRADNNFLKAPYMPYPSEDNKSWENFSGWMRSNFGVEFIG